MSRKDVVQLHNHTEYSLRDGGAKAKNYIKRAMELGMHAFAITEHGNMHSVMEFYNGCCDNSHSLITVIGKKLKIDEEEMKAISKEFPVKMILSAALQSSVRLQEYRGKYPQLFQEVLDKEIKPIIGVEAYVIPTEEMAKSDDNSVKHTKNHLVLLAKDITGYHQLVKAVTKAQLLKDKKTYPRMTYKDLETFFVGGHVIAFSGCLQGEIPRLLLNGKYEEASKKAQYFETIFGKGNFYIELQDHGIPEEKDILPQLIKISGETGIPCVATNDSHYVKKEDSKVRDMLVAMRFGTTVTDPGFEKDCGELYVKSADEMYNLFKQAPEAVENTVKIAEQCNIVFEKKKHFPVFKVPGGKTEKEFITELAYQGIKLRFPIFDTCPKKWKDQVIDRLEYELDTIFTLHYEGYLLIVQDFLAFARKKGLVGPGRGSAVGSLVCYLIGITNVNPLKYDLIFERFLNKERVSDPDIDSDFAPMIRPLVIQYVQEKYGYEAVSNIITFGSLGARAAIRNAGRVYGVELNICDRIAKKVPSKPGITIMKAMEENPDLKSEYDNKEDIHELIDNALLIEGLIVQTGVHAAGVIIADRAVSDYVPLIYDEDENIWITQFDKDVCEADAGLLKMDFLGLENLNIIGRTIKDIEKNHGVKIVLEDIDLNDKEVIKEIFCKGKTKAVFQFESSGMVSLLKRFQPQNLEDLILLNAAYRPGPLQYLDGIIEVKQKKKKPQYIISDMAKILDLTYGSPIYQEQIMRIFNEIAGFSLGVSDIIRRAMSKKKLKALKKYLPSFKDKLIKAGASAEDADKFCTELMDFASYAFNKSHATAYAVIAYWTGWMKHYYPVEYMANVLTSSNTKSLPVYVKECKDMGIPVLPPSVNESGRYFTPTKNKTIRFGLAGVKNVGKSCSDILEERDKCEFKSLKDFIERMVGSRAVFKQVMESLIMTGSFDDFKLNRRQMMEGCVGYVKDLKDLKKKKDNPKTRPATLARALAKVDDSHFDLTLPEYEKSYILEQEKELIGFYASGHPLQEYQKIIDEKAEMMIGDIDEDSDGKYVTVVGQINQVIPLARKSDGAAMAKFTIEDLTGEVESICFTKAFEECGKRIIERAVVILIGKVMVDIERDPDTNEIITSDIQISVKDVLPITSEKKVYIRLKNIYEWQKAKDILNNYQGNDKLYVYFEDEQQLYETKMLIKASNDIQELFSKDFGDNNITVVQGA